MGTSRDEFVKYPRTPHLFGSTGTADDRHLDAEASNRFLADRSLIVEEKIDGTNVGIHFTDADEMILQCRGHRITEGMHPQYDLLKQWTAVKRSALQRRLENRFILFGEWVYARHTIHYRRLPHYLFEFDIYDKTAGVFLSLERRMRVLEGSGIPTVPVLHCGPCRSEQLDGLIGPSAFDGQFEHPQTGASDSRMEGLYLRTEGNGVVTARAKWVRPVFVEKIRQSTHWQSQRMIPNLLADDADIWS